MSNQNQNPNDNVNVNSIPNNGNVVNNNVNNNGNINLNQQSIANSLSQANLQQLQLRLPNLLSDQEKLLPDIQRDELFKYRMMSLASNPTSMNNFIANGNSNGVVDSNQQQLQMQGKQRLPSNGNVNTVQQQQQQFQPQQQQQNNNQIQNQLQSQIPQSQSQSQAQAQLQPPQQKPSPMMNQQQQQGMMNPQQQPQQQLQQQPQQQQQQMQQQQMQMQNPQNQQQQQQQQPMNGQNQASYQDQLRLQQHAQQQQHLAAMLEKTQRLQQQAVQAQAQQQQQQPPQLQTPQQQQSSIMPPPMNHPTPASIAAASPQNHPHSSPQMVRQSPVSNPSRNGFSMSGIKTLVENFPKLLELKRTGKLGQEQEKLFDSYMSSAEGRNHLQQYQAHHARSLIESGLANPVGLPHGAQQPQQTPMMNGMQMPLAAQQQMAALQHHQQQQQQQQGFPQQNAHSALQAQIQQQYPGGVNQQVMGNQQQGQQMQSPQLNQQQMHQIQLQRLAAAQAQAAQQQQQVQAQQGRTPMQNHTQLPNNVNLNQAQMLARAQMQQQQQQSQGQTNGQQYPDPQQGQQQQQQQQQQPNFGSPRPPAPPRTNAMQQFQMNIQGVASKMPADKQAHVQALLMRMASIGDQQREAMFAANPQYRSLWNQVAGFSQVQQIAQQAQVVQSQALQAAQAQAQVQGMAQPPQGVSSPHMGMQQPMNGPAPGTPSMQARPNNNASTPNFNAPSNVPNLHIPANKQRNLAQAQNQGQTPNGQATSSPQMRPPIPQASQLQVQAQQAQAAQAQAGLIQRMINSGIPVAQAVQNVAQARQQQQQQQQLGMANGGQPGAPNGIPFQGQGQVPGQPGIPNQMNSGGGSNITPGMLIAQIDQNGMNRPSMRIGDQIRQPSDMNIQQLDKSQSLLSKAKFEPTPETDLILKEKLNKFHPIVKASGRGTMGINRVLGEVTLEKMNENLKLILDEAAQEAQEENDDKPVNDISTIGIEGSGTGYSIGLQGLKKRKIQDLAEGVDKALSVDSDVETLMLQLADEHNDIVSQISCSLAKHRKSDTIDRKDVQLAYETIFGRSIPGFSSDLIRLDQARSSRVRPINPQRAIKLKLVNEAKSNWRKEREKKDDEDQTILTESKDGQIGNTSNTDLPQIANGTASSNGMVIPPSNMSAGGIQVSNGNSIGGNGLGEGVAVVV